MPAELTNFLQEYFEDRLNYELNQLGMGFYTKKEKTFKDFRFDMYAYSRKARTFLIWELEINNNLESCINNVKKIRKYILNQEEHHRKMSFKEEWEILLKKHNVVLIETA